MRKSELIQWTIWLVIVVACFVSQGCSLSLTDPGPNNNVKPQPIPVEKRVPHGE